MVSRSDQILQANTPTARTMQVPLMAYSFCLEFLPASFVFFMHCSLRVYSWGTSLFIVFIAMLAGSDMSNGVR